MRLDRLHIRSRFKNLADFQIDFDEASEMTVLVGHNGTGKSNLLEALTIIFRDLDLGLRPAFSYELRYFCRGHIITVDANPDRRSQLGYELTADGEHLTWRAFHDNPTREYLPNFVFGYYSGPSNRMEGHFERHQEAFYRQLLNNNDQPLRPLFFARPVHSQFVLLAFFLDTDPVVATFLREHLWIEAFDHALFIMREPPWTSRQGDPRFWNCESNDSRSDRPMDHYRPKNAIAECATHGGYWWLAFSWDNFRYCCTFCNSKRVDKEHGTTGGKHDHFPLWTDGIRATFGKCGPDELEREKPMLLDPCCETDPPLLWFDEDGKSMPHPHLCGAQGTFLYERVTTSITLYHLDHHKIVDRRQQLYQTIKRKLAQAEEKLRRLRDHADMTARHSLEDLVRELKEFMRPEQPYSATAKCAIMALRGSYTVAGLALHGV